MTSSTQSPIIGELQFVTDGVKDGGDGYYVELDSGIQWLQIDLGRPQEVWAILLWHFHKSVRVYFDVIVQVSNDPKFEHGVTTLYNNDHDNSSKLGPGADAAWVETNHGRIFDLPGLTARYIRFYSNGNTANDLNHYIEVEVWGKGGANHHPEPSADNTLWEAVASLESQTESAWTGMHDGPVDLEWLRHSHSQVLAAMLTAIEKEGAHDDAVERVRHFADRWWAVDGASTIACQHAARAMAALGRRDLEWAYLTTPVAVSNGDSSQWRLVLEYANERNDPVLVELSKNELSDDVPKSR